MRWVVCLLLLMGCGFIGKAGWIHAKAWLAQILIAQAWEETLNDEENHKPWPWADSWPIARLKTPQGKSLYVLQSVSGQALAFGPGHVTESAQPGENGKIILAGHRDTHFMFLQSVELEEVFSLQDRTGKIIHYEVTDISVIDADKSQLTLDSDQNELALITCYPFAGISAETALRYVVSAKSS